MKQRQLCPTHNAAVVELADTQDLGSCAVKSVEVQVLSAAPQRVIQKIQQSIFIRSIFLFVFFSLFFFAPSSKIFASTEQAYKDYIYHYDLYRKDFNDFQVAKNEYEKFHSLVAQTTALETAKKMLSQRDEMLRMYLLMLSEKILETSYIADSERELYQTLIQNETVFLKNHSDRIPSISSIADASQTSGELEDHYLIYQKSTRQILTGISLGIVRGIQTSFDQTSDALTALIAKNQSVIPLRKQVILDRWLLQIKNKRQNSQTKLDEVATSNYIYNATTNSQLDKQYQDQIQSLEEAKRYLQEGTSFMKEVLDAIKYQD